MAGRLGAMKNEAAGACQLGISRVFPLKSSGAKRWQLWFLKTGDRMGTGHALAAKAV
jgi:hypothetical protein